MDQIGLKNLTFLYAPNDQTLPEVNSRAPALRQQTVDRTNLPSGQLGQNISLLDTFLLYAQFTTRIRLIVDGAGISACRAATIETVKGRHPRPYTLLLDISHAAIFRHIETHLIEEPNAIIEAHLDEHLWAE